MASTNNNCNKTLGLELNDFITIKDVQLLNVSKNIDSINVIKPDSTTTAIVSDTDEQVLITIPFAVNIKLNSFIIEADNIPNNAAPPKLIKM